jgi:hypothetical protein
VPSLSLDTAQQEPSVFAQGSRSFAIFYLVTVLCLVFSRPAFGQEEEAPPRNWSNSTELSWVATSGNSNTYSFSVRNLYKYTWDKSELTWEAGALRAASADDWYAVGTPGDFEVIEPDPELDNNRLYSKLRFSRRLNERFFWYVSYDSARDEPTSINRQLIASGGVGNLWYDREGLMLRTTYGANYTNEELDLEGASNFGGYRLFYRLEAGVTEGTGIESELTFDGSFETADDLRLDALNGVSVAISDTIALKASVRLNYRNIPALEDIDLELPIGGIVIGEVVVPKKKLDSTLATSLVISF